MHWGMPLLLCVFEGFSELDALAVVGLVHNNNNNEQPWGLHGHLRLIFK